MIDPLNLLWPLIEFPDPVVAASVVTLWPTGVHQRLLDMDLMQRAEDAHYVLCPECREHQEEVIALDGPDNHTRLFVPCPKVLRAEVQSEMLRQWIISLEGVTVALASTLGLSGRCTELVAQRLWRLGRTNWQGASRDVMFARGLQWDDARGVRAEIVRGRKPIVFVALGRPPSDFWQRSVPPVLVLSHFTTLCDDQIEVDALAIATAIRDVDTAVSSEGLVTVTEKQLKLIIRQQIKAENKTELSDDILIAAYRHSGSTRGAAAYLSQQTRQDVSKDQVHRALKRAGGALAVLSSENSNSVVRSVASQRRDKSGKPIRQSKPIEEE